MRSSFVEAPRIPSCLASSRDAKNAAPLVPLSAHRNLLGQVAFDTERTSRGRHSDRWWAIALACQRERVLGRGGAGLEIGVRVIG